VLNTLLSFLIIDHQYYGNVNRRLNDEEIKFRKAVISSPHSTGTISISTAREESIMLFYKNKEKNNEERGLLYGITSRSQG
jgi:hypothetical protein